MSEERTEKKLESPYLTINEAADYTKLSKTTLYQYASERRIPHIKAGRRLLFDRRELDEWMLSRAVKADRVW